MTDLYYFDPLQLWRDAVSKLEKSANERANAQLKTPGVARSLQDAAVVSFGLQQAYAKMAENYLRQANLPSRKQVQDLADALQRIEDKLDGLMPAAAVPQPARTRRPTSVPAAPATTPPKPAAARQAAGQSRRTRGAKGPVGPRNVNARSARTAKAGKK